MGINDDRLEVLTRRVMLDHQSNYTYMRGRQLKEISKEYTIKYERRPQKLDPLYPHADLPHEGEVEESPIEVVEKEPTPPQTPPPEVESESSSDDDPPPIALVTRPKNDKEDFDIPVHTLIPDPEPSIPVKETEKVESQSKQAKISSKPKAPKNKKASIKLKASKPGTKSESKLRSNTTDKPLTKTQPKSKNEQSTKVLTSKIKPEK